MSNFKKFTQSFSELESINASHNLAPVDLVKAFTAGLTIAPGTVLKNNAGTGAKEPWIQGTDNANTITGVYAGAVALNTTNQSVGLVRVFGPVKKSKLVAWTAADGSTTAAANAASIAALEALQIFAL